MTYTKTVWKDLPDTTTPITASRLQNIEDGVEYLFENSEAGIEIKNEYSNLQNSVYSCNYVNSINTYSTDEVKTNKIWIDGKPIYRKIYEFSNISPNDTKHTALDIDNLYRIVNWGGSVETNGTARSCFVSGIIPYVHYQLGNIYVSNTGSETISSISVIIEYTKTN